MADRRRATMMRRICSRPHAVCVTETPTAATTRPSAKRINALKATTTRRRTGTVMRLEGFADREVQRKVIQESALDRWLVARGTRPALWERLRGHGGHRIGVDHSSIARAHAEHGRLGLIYRLGDGRGRHRVIRGAVG